MAAEKNEANPFTLTVLLVGLFPGMIATLLLGRHTFILIDTAFHYFLLFGTIVLIFHLPLRKRMNRYWAELIAYCYIGWGGIMTAIFLTLNMFFHADPAVTRYGLKEGYALYALTYPVHIEIDDAKYKDYGYMLDFDQDEVAQHSELTQAWMTTAHGLFGYDVLLNKELR